MTTSNSRRKPGKRRYDDRRKGHMPLPQLVQQLEAVHPGHVIVGHKATLKEVWTRRSAIAARPRRFAPQSHEPPAKADAHGCPTADFICGPPLAGIAAPGLSIGGLSPTRQGIPRATALVEMGAMRLIPSSIAMPFRQRSFGSSGGLNRKPSLSINNPCALT